MTAAPENTTANKHQPKTLARLLVVQALFEIESSRRRYSDVVDDFLAAPLRDLLDFDVAESSYDRKLFKGLVGSAVTQQVKIDKAIDAALIEKWKLARVDPLLRAVFRAAGAEIVLGKTPPKVVISEFVTVTRAFTDTRDEINFVNAILDHMRDGLAA